MTLDKILRGYRVLDLSQYLPGPYATRVLADLGADVVKVEPPAGDPMRHFIFLDEDNISPLYKQINAGKTIVTIDLKDDAGRKGFRDLVMIADVLLESYRPGVMERLGFGRSVLQSLNPGLVHCALSGFGQDGPAAQRAGHDLTYLALSGMLSHTGTEKAPVIPFPPISDYAGGQQAATMILAALLSKKKTGEGTFIDTSLFETVLSWQSFGQAGVNQPEGQLKPGFGLINGGVACYQIYPTADGKFVVLGALEGKFWAAFCSAVEHPEWISRQHEPMPQSKLIQELRDLFVTQPRNYWVERLSGVDCCFEPLLEPNEVVNYPHVQHRGLVAVPCTENKPADIRFPVILNGEKPLLRSSLSEASPEVVIDRWQKMA